MSVLGVEHFLQPLSEEAPTGEDLEYDPAFGELERAVRGKAEQQFGDTIVPAEEPDWAEVKRLGLDLMARTKDMRVIVHLIQGLLHTNGLPGLSDGFAVLRGITEEYWDTVYPLLDPDDGNDPTLRINTIASLCDADAMLKPTREAPLVSSRAIGKFSMRDIAVASGEMDMPADSEEAPPQMTTIDGAFQECDLEELQEMATAVEAAAGHVAALEEFTTEKVGAGNAADLSPMSDLLKQAAGVLSDRLLRRGVGAADAEESDEQVDGSAASPSGAPISGQINCREDVNRMIDKICDYYARQEPSSPVPVLLQRAKRLVSKSFLEIVRDLTPRGVEEAEVFQGGEERTE